MFADIIIILILYVLLYIFFILKRRYLEDKKNRLLIQEKKLKRQGLEYDEVIETINMCKNKLMDIRNYINMCKFLLCISVLFNALKILNSRNSYYMLNEHETSDYLEEYSSIYISDIHYSIWDDLLEECLQYEIWEHQKASNNNDQMRVYYANAIAEMPDSGIPIDLKKLNQYIKELQVLGYLPKSERSLAEIDNEISEYKVKGLTVSSDLYIEELVKRIEHYQRTPSCSNSYQIGRASMDILIQKN